MLMEWEQGEGGFAGLGSFQGVLSLFVGKLVALCCVTVFEDSGGGWKYILAGPRKGQSSSGSFLVVLVATWVLCDIMPVLV